MAFGFLTSFVTSEQCRAVDSVRGLGVACSFLGVTDEARHDSREDRNDLRYIWLMEEQAGTPAGFAHLHVC